MTTLLDLRARILSGNPPSDDEMFEVLQALTQDRQQAVANAQEKAKSQYYDLDNLFPGPHTDAKQAKF